MMNESEKIDVLKRLKRIEGQIRGVINMVDENRYCVDILNQTKAINSAIEKVDNLIIKQHLNSCVVNAIKSGNKEDKDTKIDEIIQLFSKYRN